MKYLVCVPIANIRKEPNLTSELIDQVLHGWPVEVLEKHGEFLKIKTFYNYEGYIKKEDIVKINKTVNYSKEKSTVQYSSHVITQPFADLSAGETVQHYVKITIPAGSYVGMIGEGEKYSFVRNSTGATSGYIRNKFLKTFKKPVFSLEQLEYDEEELRQNLIKTAQMYMGVQYRWGGKTHMGIDCSGLVFMSYLINGIILYRDAKIKEGFAAKEIEKEDIKLADLIYFKGHVGMYIGDGKMIHSSDTNGGVAIDQLENLPWDIIAYASVF